MKRKAALLLAVVMLVTALMPVGAFAAEDKEFSQVIETVKAKLEVPDSYTKFDFNVYTRGNTRIWGLQWYKDEKREEGIIAQANQNGRIISYSFQKPYKNENKSSFPKISREEARIAAEKFMEKIDPGLTSQLKLQEDQNPASMNWDYNFSYYRVVNGIPFRENNASINVDRNTGKINNYYLSWYEGVKFPEAKPKVSLDEAGKAYREKLGIRLTYNTRYDYAKNELKLFGAFAPIYPTYFCIDANTGERVAPSGVYRGYDNAADVQFSMAKKDALVSGSSAQLNPEEIKAVNEISKLMTKDQAEAKARSIKQLGLTDKYKVNEQPSLQRDWMYRQQYSWHMSFVLEPEDKTKETAYVYVSLDAVTGEVRSFNIGAYYGDNAEPKFDKAAAKAAADAFVKEFAPDKYSRVEFEETPEYIIPRPLAVESKEKQYSFRYTRKVNGTAFPDNNISVVFDAVTGKITNYSVRWYEGQIPSLNGALALDAAYEVFFKEIGLELQYVADASLVSDKVAGPVDRDNLPVRLVYGVKLGKPVFFDAFTGGMLDYNGEPYKEQKPIKYSDIKGHFAEKQITMLAEFGIGLSGDTFRPDDKIVQKDFLALISRAFVYSGYGVLPQTDKEFDEMYRMLEREGIVRDGDRAPESAITREDAVKFIIRALRYDRVADIKGIFVTSFEDKDSINPDLLGYVAIAAGMKLVQGDEGMFRPKAQMTRAEAVVMLYNYFQN